MEPWKKSATETTHKGVKEKTFQIIYIKSFK